MKRLISSFAAVAVSVLAVSGAAQAGMYSTSVTAAIQALQSGEYTVKRIDALDSDTALSVESRAAVNADAVQEAVRSNPALASELASRHVQIGNIVEANEAANGNVTFYLR